MQRGMKAEEGCVIPNSLNEAILPSHTKTTKTDNRKWNLIPVCGVYRSHIRGVVTGTKPPMWLAECPETEKIEHSPIHQSEEA